ncbi:MAG: pantetheine-phosphate adenylyltransferase [Dysgonamonadaceae bacterium]|jgi:pantetheine-phosphate adenylyltransferase|nr:pantetheine-phosphate adenylyltransferase [Dysgonamonadaceae bacterium]
MSKTAIFPGTFDPFTLGHLSLVERGLQLFDEIIVAIGVNTDKKAIFTTEQRLEMISRLFQENPKVRVETYTGLTVDFAKAREAGFILRGIRSVGDFEYEKNIANVNREISNLETVILFTDPEYSYISSSIVRELWVHGKSIDDFVPKKLGINEYKK